MLHSLSSRSFSLSMLFAHLCCFVLFPQMTPQPMYQQTPMVTVCALCSLCVALLLLSTECLESLGCFDMFTTAVFQALTFRDIRVFMRCITYHRTFSSLHEIVLCTASYISFFFYCCFCCCCFFENKCIVVSRFLFMLIGIKTAERRSEHPAARIWCSRVTGVTGRDVDG